VGPGDQFNIGLRTNAVNQEMNLHQKIRKILSDFGFIEESLPEHHARLRWKNVSLISMPQQPYGYRFLKSDYLR
jgi:hypothetical protein